MRSESNFEYKLDIDLKATLNINLTLSKFQLDLKEGQIFFTIEMEYSKPNVVDLNELTLIMP